MALAHLKEQARVVPPRRYDHVLSDAQQTATEHIDYNGF
jgi:hypothetical protein